MRFKVRTALALAAVPAMLALATAPAQAAGGGWDATGSSGDIAGAWAHGTLWKTSDGRWHLNGELKDTASDSKGAALRIYAIYTDFGTRNEVVRNANGAGAIVPIGEYNFAGNLYALQLEECTMSRGSDGIPYISACAPGAKVLYTS